jgi:hypothetical protein
VQTIRSQLETGTLVVSGGANKDGHATLYMKPGLFFPGKDSTDLLIQSLVYCLSTMSDMNEKTCTMGGFCFNCFLLFSLGVITKAIISIFV